MKKYIFIILCCFLIAPLKATHCEHDSLRLFLENIGEDSVIISQIMSSPDTITPNRIVDNYLSLLRLKFNQSQQQYEWYPGWEDSLYACKYVEYMSQKIVRDTTIYLIGDYLEDAYLMLYNHEYAAQILLGCAEYAIEKFHARSGYLIPDLYYHKEDVADWQKKLQYYEMIKMIFLPQKHIFSFDENTNIKLNNIIAEKQENSHYYFLFKSMLDSYSNIDLARITKEQEKVLVNIILQGIASGEKMSQMIYAFMLLTGQFVEKNDITGNEILSGLL